jgi:hypothetical protein
MLLIRPRSCVWRLALPNAASHVRCWIAIGASPGRVTMDHGADRPEPQANEAHGPSLWSRPRLLASCTLRSRPRVALHRRRRLWPGWRHGGLQIVAPHEGWCCGCVELDGVAAAQGAIHMHDDPRRSGWNIRPPDASAHAVANFECPSAHIHTLTRCIKKPPCYYTSYAKERVAAMPTTYVTIATARNRVVLELPQLIPTTIDKPECAFHNIHGISIPLRASPHRTRQNAQRYREEHNERADR